MARLVHMGDYDDLTRPSRQALEQFEREQEEKRDLQTYPPNKRQKNQVRTTDLSKEEVTHFLF